MASNILISVIIPAYNVEEYLSKCLDSVVNQTMSSENYEVIIVNDGSTDHTGQIIDKFIKYNENFVAINEENAGLSRARNAGIKVATGEYISFLDGDDFWEPSFLTRMYNACRSTGAEISYCGYYKYFPKNGSRFAVPFTPKTKVMSKQEALKALVKDNFLRFYAWNKLYKRSLFIEHDIKFPDMYFEDIATIPKLFYYSNRIAVLNRPLYNYTKRENSILSSMNVAKVNDYIRASGEIRNFLESKEDFDDYKNSFNYEVERGKLCNYYSILRIHCLTANPKGIIKNLKNSNKSFNYFKSNKFDIYNSNPFIPYPVTTPENKKLKK